MQKAQLAEEVNVLASDSPAPNRRILIAGLLIAMLFAALDNTIVGTAMPRIVSELGGLGLMAWVTTAYMLSSTTIVPIAGKLADLFGRKLIYITGLLIFILGSALCGLSQTMHQLIWFRGLQGVGGGIMMPLAMIVIGDLFTGKQRARWQGVFGAVFSLASVIGPQVGGWLVDSINWRWVFYINLPVGVLAVILIAIGLKEERVKKRAKIDFAGIFTMMVGVVSLLLALTLGGKDYDWNSWQILGLLALSAVFLLAFVIVEAKVEEPILPLHFFKKRIFTVINGLAFLMSAGMFGTIMFVPLFMQGVVGMSATDSGTIMTPMMICAVITSVLGGRLVPKTGVRSLLLAGMAIMGIGFFLLSTMDVHTAKWTAMGYIMVIGLGMGFIMPNLTLALQESFPRSELGVVTSSSQFFRSIGGTFGVTILGTVMNNVSTRLLNEKLTPFFSHLPPQAQGMAARFKEMVDNDPQGLYSMLLNPEMVHKMPTMVVQHLAPVLRETLVDSLHQVFLFGLGFVAAGLVLAFFTGKVRISDERKGFGAPAD